LIANVKARMKNVETAKKKNGTKMLVISRILRPIRNPKKDIADQFMTPRILMNPVKNRRMLCLFFSTVPSTGPVMTWRIRSVGLYEY